MANQRLKGDESFIELRRRAVAKYNAVRERRGETGKRCGPRGRNPVSTTDLVLIGEANFLIALSELREEGR
jgi:hypothetical protein